MTDPTDKDVLIEVMSPLVTGLYSSLDPAMELAQQHFIDFDMTVPSISRRPTISLVLTADDSYSPPGPRATSATGR